MDLNEGGALGGGTQTSVRPVDGPDGEALLAAAVKEHRINPWSFENAAQELTFNDQSTNHTQGSTPSAMAASIPIVMRSSAPVCPSSAISPPPVYM